MTLGKYFIRNFNFPNPIMNASGCWCTTDQELITLTQSESAAVVSKSSTLLDRYGNEMPRYYENDSLSINSTGLANKGFEFYNDIGEIIKQYKPFFLCKWLNPPIILTSIILLSKF